MGFYERVIFPRIMDKLMSGAHLVPLRTEALAPARGRVLEVGFGTGLNLPHYPGTVSELVGLDSNPGMARKAETRIAASSIKVERATSDGSSLPFDAKSFDTVVLTWTLCSIHDADRALGEIRRVMKSDARLLLVEHGLADDPKVQKWQRRLNPLNKVLACGCNLDRDISGMVERNGFAFDHLRTFYMEKEPAFSAYTYLGEAVVS